MWNHYWINLKSKVFVQHLSWLGIIIKHTYLCFYSCQQYYIFGKGGVFFNQFTSSYGNKEKWNHFIDFPQDILQYKSTSKWIKTDANKSYPWLLLAFAGFLLLQFIFKVSWNIIGNPFNSWNKMWWYLHWWWNKLMFCTTNGTVFASNKK